VKKTYRNIDSIGNLPWLNYMLYGSRARRVFSLEESKKLLILIRIVHGYRD
jgi:hypothetical protein